MKDEYDADFDSPEARANFATRHIRNLEERRRRREELLQKFANETVVDIFPGRTANGDLGSTSTEDMQ